MKFNRKDPCKQCPFKKNSAPGWLGAYSISDIKNAILNEEVFPCHPTVNYEDHDFIKNQIMNPDSKVQFCAGFAILSKRLCKLPRDKDMSNYWRNVINKDSQYVFDSFKDFEDYHTKKKDKK